MKLTDRIGLAYKALTLDSNLGNSLGTVLRNYAKQSEFAPQQQLKGITYKAIETIAQAVSLYEPRVIKPNGDKFENHPLYNLFNRPNPRQNATDFLTLWSFQYEIYGETFIYKARGESSGKIKELYLLNPASIELVIAEGELQGYKMHKNDGGHVFFELDEIIHDKRSNPFNEWRGMSVMERASDYVNIEITTTSFTLNYMRNNASPSGIVTLPNMTKETFNQFAQQWREGYEGPTNAGKTAFVRGEGVDFKAVGATLQDVDQEVTRKMSKEDVLMMFGVPQGLLGTSGSKGLGVNEIEPLEYIFAKYTTEPRMKRLDRIWETLILEGNKIDQAKDVTHESPIPDDKRFQLETHKTGVNVWLTVNEVREQQGLDPLDTEFDKIQPRASITSIQPTEPIKHIKLSKPITKDIEADNEAFRARSEQIVDIYTVKTKRAISKHFAQQEKNVIAKINASTKSFEEWLFSVKAESVALHDAILPIMVELIEEQARNAKNLIGGDVFVFGAREKEIVSKRIIRVAGVSTEKTLKKLEEVIAKDIAEGKSLVTIKKSVENVYKQSKGHQAETIARTESARTGNMTAEEVYRQNGFTYVQWYTNPEACEYCEGMKIDHGTKAIGTTFMDVGGVVNGINGGQMALSYDDINNPPLHPNCKCSIVPVGSSYSEDSGTSPSLIGTATAIGVATLVDEVINNES